MQKQIGTFIIALLVSIGAPTIAAAHGTGVSYEEDKEGYKIDIGHDEFIAAGELTRFDFLLYPEDMSDAEGDVFTDVWVTLSKDKEVFFAGGIDKPVFGSTGFAYAFLEPGTHIVSARFQKEGETIVKTEFPLEILPPFEDETTPNPLLMYGLFVLAGLLTGMAIGMFIPRKNSII